LRLAQAKKENKTPSLKQMGHGGMCLGASYTGGILVLRQALYRNARPYLKNDFKKKLEA
jgi:hypothetical protein